MGEESISRGLTEKEEWAGRRMGCGDEGRVPRVFKWSLSIEPWSCMASLS